MNIDATKIVMTVACWMTFNGSHAEELPNLPIPIAEPEERQVILPWEGVRPWKFKNEDPWHGYPDEGIVRVNRLEPPIEDS